MNPFSRLEARMEALIEGTLARWFAGRLHPRDLAVHLARALEDSVAQGQPATRYVIHLNANDAQGLRVQDPALAAQLADDLLALARETQITLPTRPEIVFEIDPQQPPHRIRVTAEAIAAPESSQTQSLTPVRATGPLNLPKAYVILNGDRLVSLVLPIINIGRRLDNQLIIEDSRVSRVHAQLRMRFGRYMIYDLGSSTGTFVNGQRVNECVLRPGDVISLGGVTLIYGEEEPAAHTSGKVMTAPLDIGRVTPTPPPPTTTPNPPADKT